MNFDPRQTIIAGVLVLFLGKYLNNKIDFLHRFNIPEPVTGGLVASAFWALLFLTLGVDVHFSTHYRDILLVVFFTAIGLSTSVSSIIKGGRVLLILTVLAVGFIFLQNYLAIAQTHLFHLSPYLGILAGSAALQGGHGNVVSWVPVLQEYQVTHAMEIGMLTATLGLIFGGLLGGPIARFLIQRHHLEPDATAEMTVGARRGENPVVDYDSMLKVIFLLALSIGIGIQFHNLLDRVHFTLPLFATCMLGGVILINALPPLIPALRGVRQSRALAIVSDLSLGLFLAMAMMSLRFWELGQESLFILLNIVLQTIFILLFTVLVLFRLLGKDYTAAVISAGYIGSALGATPTAMANMAAVTREYGPSPIAFAVVSIVGAFVIQVSNAMVINIILILLK